SSPPNPATSPTSAWPGTCRRPAATGWPRCWPSSGTTPAPPSPDERTARVPAGQRRLPLADAVPHLRDVLLPDRRGLGRLARLRTHPRPVVAGPDRAGRGDPVLLRGAVLGLPGRPPATAQAGRPRLRRAGGERDRAGADRRRGAAAARAVADLPGDRHRRHRPLLPQPGLQRAV